MCHWIPYYDDDDDDDTEERKGAILTLLHFIQEKVKKNQIINGSFTCTLMWWLRRDWPFFMRETSESTYFFFPIVILKNLRMSFRNQSSITNDVNTSRLSVILFESKSWWACLMTLSICLGFRCPVRPSVAPSVNSCLRTPPIIQWEKS